MTASEKGISGCGLPFEWIAKEFKLIDQNTFAVYIPIGEGKELVSRLREGERSRGLYRRAGMYSVSVYQNQFDSLINAGAAERSARMRLSLRIAVSIRMKKVCQRMWTAEVRCLTDNECFIDR